MSFPFSDYDAIAAECRKIIEDRDAKGRNSFLQFYETRCHGVQDVTGELWQRMTRILGAERVNDYRTMREDLRDMANEAIFAIMFLDRKDDDHGEEDTHG